MRTIAYLIILLGIAASEPARFLSCPEIGIPFPIHPLIPAVRLFEIAVQALAGG